MSKRKLALYESAPALTKEIIRQHYLRNSEFVFSHLADDVMWIGPLEHQVVFSKKEVEELLNAEKEIVFSLVNSEFHLVLTDENSCVVVGWAEICTDEDSGYVLKCRQRITFIYKVKKEQLIVTHMHVSESWDVLGEDEIFPFRAAKQTYQYMQQLIKMKFENHKKIMVYDTQRRAHFIMENEIIYVEASNIHCYLYCVNGKLLITEGITEFAEKLSERFLRVHRSFIVNIDYIIGMERFYVQLCEGSKIPVPEKKYVAVREEIRRRLPFEEAAGIKRIM